MLSVYVDPAVAAVTAENAARAANDAEAELHALQKLATGSINKAKVADLEKKVELLKAKAEKAEETRSIAAGETHKRSGEVTYEVTFLTGTGSCICPLSQPCSAVFCVQSNRRSSLIDLLRFR